MALAFWVCASILLLTQIADYYSSKVAFERNPKAREANWIVRKIGLIPAKIIGSVLLTWMAYALSFVNPNVGLLVTATVAVTGFYAWVVLHNFKIAGE